MLIWILGHDFSGHYNRLVLIAVDIISRVYCISYVLYAWRDGRDGRHIFMRWFMFHCRIEDNFHPRTKPPNPFGWGYNWDIECDSVAVVPVGVAFVVVAAVLFDLRVVDFSTVVGFVVAAVVAVGVVAGRWWPLRGHRLRPNWPTGRYPRLRARDPDLSGSF